MRKRPDYGDATLEDLVRALMRVHRKTARYRQSVPDTSVVSQPSPAQPASSGPECPAGEGCASQRTHEHSDPDV